MTLDLLRSFLLCCTLLNYAVLLIWFGALVLAPDALHRLHGRWFPMGRERFLALHYGLMGGYKLAILMLNLVPWVALVILR